ncbi:RING finger protein 17 [Varanus komodoensis]|nr:RING finger protein 17 [Varanus komodoensis]
MIRPRGLQPSQPDQDCNLDPALLNSVGFAPEQTRVILDFEQKGHMRSLETSERINNYKRSIKEKKNPALETSTTDMDSKILQEVEEGLEEAKSNLKCLKSIEEVLEDFVTEAKQQEGKISCVLNTNFEDLVDILNLRKRKLETELAMNTSYYITEVRSIQVSVLQKKSNLDAAIKTAKELKATHCLKSCQNLNQVIHNLKMTIEDEVLKLDNLEKRTLPRFYMDCDRIIPVLENLGKFSYDIPNEQSLEGRPLKLGSVEDESKSDAPSHMNIKQVSLVKELDAVGTLQKSGAYLQENYSYLQKTAPLLDQRNAVALSQSASTPDVIIEEIIEDGQENSTELVFVSCVVNPCHFYVRKVSQKKTAVHLEKMLRSFCSTTNTSPSDILELGTRIFVKSKEHRMWCRANIVELIPLKHTNEWKPCGPAKYKITDIAMMKVFLVDFGHPEALIVSGIPNEVIVNPEHVKLDYVMIEDLCLVVRKPDLLIEGQLHGINKLALQCSLKDIVPKHSTEGWNRSARAAFLKMVNNKAVLMKVFREEDGVLIVDLMKPPANKISSDMPVSLRDALVFLDLASFRTELADQSENNVPLNYFPPVIPQEDTEVPVVVSYINSPGDFYIQLLEEGPDFAVFLTKVEEMYKNEGEVGLEILCPILGQPCIARFEDDGVWYRAQVIGLPGHQEVEVKYVDFGNTAKINVKDMRKIKDEFIILPEKAIKCKLAHIKPCKGLNEWSIKSKQRFQELIQDKCMFCFITEKLQDNVLSVELYEGVSVSPNLPCSVNSLLVEEGLASYISRNTRMALRSYTNIWDSVVEESSNQTTRSHNEVWDPALEEILKPERDALKPKEEDLSQYEELRLECNRELEVKINHVVSPSKIFVFFMSSEQILKSLQEKMAATYVESVSETVQWKIDMNCAAYVHDLNQWQRGRICRIVSEKVVEVFLLDVGIVKVMDTVCLRQLAHNLSTIRPLAVECSLTDIRPAGGTEHWTATACDVLASYLTGAVVSLIIQESQSLPLLVKIVSKEGGLCTDVSEYMIKEGMALRKRRASKTDSSTVSSDKTHEMHFQPKNAVLLAEAECIPNPFAPEQVPDASISHCKKEKLEISVTQSVTVEAYKPPAIPRSDHFAAIVSCVSDNGTIYVIPTSKEQELNKLMSDIQKNFKCLGLLEPYSWKKGEACVVRAADTMWYRGEVRDVGGGIIIVQYLDYGYIEKIPQCHLHPTLLYADIAPFSIPCQLYKTIPVGNVWQQDAIELLQELLTKRLVEIHVKEQPDNPWGKVSIKLCFAGLSLSSFMAYHKHCISEEDGCIPKLDIADCSEDDLEENCEISHEELLMSEVETPLLPPYSLPTLPVLGELFPVKVTHIISPNEVYISFDQSDSANQRTDKDSGISLDSETLAQALSQCNENIESIPFLTDFRKDMPCLAKYRDDLWYRAKLLSINEFNPLSILVEFVDYGSTDTLPTSRFMFITTIKKQSPEKLIWRTYKY